MAVPALEFDYPSDSVESFNYIPTQFADIYDYKVSPLPSTMITTTTTTSSPMWAAGQKVAEGINLAGIYPQLEELSRFTVYHKKKALCRTHGLIRHSISRAVYESKVTSLLCTFECADELTRDMIAKYFLVHYNRDKVRKLSSNIKWVHHQMLEHDGLQEREIIDRIRYRFNVMDMVISGRVLDGYQGVPLY